MLYLMENEYMTTHKVMAADSSSLDGLNNRSVDLIVTSPPYPMIEMWDEVFSMHDKSIADCMENGKGHEAFAKMHAILDRTWLECDRVLKSNGFICINIGDATRKLNDSFELYPNHSRIIDFFFGLGYSVLPDIHWRKQSNSPNKFMGSGMYPAGAYVTYEHEYILIFRKGGKRTFSGSQKALRQKSAYFWEERNVWFSDLWDIKGTSQFIPCSKTGRDRSASFPLEIPYRLVNMYSAEGDTVLDPFLGLGTTSIACMISKRNSIGIEIDPEIAELALKTMDIPVSYANRLIENRIEKHLEFIESLSDENKKKCYQNTPHGFKVKTRQETAIELNMLEDIISLDDGYVCRYKKYENADTDEQIKLSLT